MDMAIEMFVFVFIRRGGRGAGIFVTEFIKVMVFEEKLRNYVHKHLAKSNHVLVSGMIRYSLYKNAEGKERSSGYIEAASLQYQENIR